jgi:L-iditol 2-dehydrogenase
MKALLLSEYKKLEITDLPRPSPGPDEVLIKIAACGICGSDVHGYDGSSGRRIPPLVMGHEAAGVIAETGKNVTGFKPGDRVTFDSTVYCGSCAYCQRGEVNLCDNRQVVGVSCGDYCRNGAFAEYLAVPQRILYHLPDALSFPEAAMLEAVSVALHAVRLARLQGGETVRVIGAGMIGLLTLQAARALGASRLTVVDIDETRLSGPNEKPAPEDDVVLEAVGRSETIAAAIDSVRKGGTVVLIGNITPQIMLPLQKVVSRQVRLQGSAASAGEYPEAIAFVTSGKIRVRPLITAVAPLEEGPQWFSRLYAREPNLMKVVLTPKPVSEVAL